MTPYIRSSVEADYAAVLLKRGADVKPCKDGRLDYAVGGWKKYLTWLTRRKVLRRWVAILDDGRTIPIINRDTGRAFLLAGPKWDAFLRECAEQGIEGTEQA